MLADFAQNKIMEKFQIFDENHQPYPFGKIPVFQFFFLLSIFIVLKHFFPVYNMVKHIFLAYFSLKKKMEKIQINFLTKPSPFGKIPKFRLF